MASRKKTRIRTLVVGFVVFLTLNCVYVMGQQPRGKGEESAQEDFGISKGTHLYDQVPGAFDYIEELVFAGEEAEPPDPTNDPPRITSVKLVNDEDKYRMEVEAVDKDSDSLRIEVQHEGGKPDKITFRDSDVPTIDNTATFISEPFSLEPESHIFIITIRDPHNNPCTMRVTFDIQGPALEQPENLPPQILSIEHIIQQGQQNDYIIIVEVTDDDLDTVHVEVEGNPTQFNRVGATFTSQQPIYLPSGSNQLTIVARDSQGQQDKMQITIDVYETIQQTKGNQPPQILSIEHHSEKDEYNIELKIKDENLNNVGVSVEGNPEIEFKKGTVTSILSDNTMMSTFVSDSFQLDPGSHTFTIIVDDTENKTEMETTITVPQPTKDPVRGFLIILSLALMIVVVTMFLSGRRSEGITRFTEGYSRESDFMTRRDEMERYRREAEALKGNLSDIEFQLEEYKQLSKEIQNIVSQEGIDDLSRIADENSPTRKDISALLRSISRALRNLSGLNVANAKEEIESGIRYYSDIKTSLSQDEEEALSRAKDAYSEALKELRKAHGALDVKILELFLKRAFELTREQAIYGKKTQNYEASKKLSETVMSLLEDPELRIRLRKLREVGYIDPVELS